MKLVARGVLVRSTLPKFRSRNILTYRKFSEELNACICVSSTWIVYLNHSISRVVIGYDEGTIMVKLGREVPVASMDNGGKIIWAKHNEIQTVNIKSVGADYEVQTFLSQTT